jgi:hypothetical protein
MRRASALLVVVAACSISSAKTTAPPPDVGRVAPDASERRLIRISAFDCEKHEVFPGVQPPKGPVSRSSGIRSWQGGGPGGANWNVEDLRCVVQLSSSCERGRADLVLRVGKTVVAQRPVEVKSGSLDVEVPLSLKTWKSQRDDLVKRLTSELPYRTAGFRAFVAVECAAPEASLKNSAYRDVSDDDAFVAGFANGE